MIHTTDVPAVRPRKPRFNVSVKRVRRLTPRMVRVTFGGDELAGFGWNGPAAHIKLIFGAATRTYTPRRFDGDARELDVDFVIHGEGPASTWAEQAAVGQSLLVAGPGRSYAVDAGADWYVLAGDDTAIPAIATILEALPATMQASVFLEVVDADDRAALDVMRAGTQIYWLMRGSDPATAGTALESALRGFDMPAGSGRFYVACEADALRRIRRHLLQERGIAKPHVVTRGYWRLGEVDHPDRDYGEDGAGVT